MCLYYENDGAIPLSAQKLMVRELQTLGFQIKEESLPAGRFGMLSMPEETANIVLRYY